MGIRFQINAKCPKCGNGLSVEETLDPEYYIDKDEKQDLVCLFCGWRLPLVRLDENLYGEIVEQVFQQKKSKEVFASLMAEEKQEKAKREAEYKKKVKEWWKNHRNKGEVL